MITTVQTQPFNPEQKAFIMQSIYEALNDPDVGMELTVAAKRRLCAAQSKKQTWISHADLKKDLY